MILALDFETSGLDPKRHAPVSLGVAFMDGSEVRDSATWTIAPHKVKDKIAREYDVCALKISGLKWSEIQSGKSAKEVMEELETFAQAHDATELPVIAFNAPFDLAFYSELCFMAGSWNQNLRRFESFIPPLCGPWQCARMLAMRRLSLESYSLDSVIAHFGLSRSGESHGALEDAILAGQIYHRLITEMEK